MKKLTRKISSLLFTTALTGLTLSLTLAATPTLANSIIAIPSLGGMGIGVSDLNNSGQITGFSTIASELEQHAYRLSPNGLLEDLGTLGGSFSLGTAINDIGQVTGDSSTTGNLEFHSFLYSNGSMIDLGTLGGNFSSAVDINNNGDVAGNSNLPGNIESHAFLYSNGAMTDLGTLGGTFSSANSLNNLGEVVGGSTVPGSFDVHPFLYSNGAMTDLGTLGGTFATAWAINDNSVVVGESDLANGDTHAFASIGSVMTDLGTLGGTFSMAVAVNESGQIIGDSSIAGDAEDHGFIVMGGTMIDLGTLGGTFSSAMAINSTGQVVGDSTDVTGMLYPFFWENGVMVDLNTLLPLNSGWELWSAFHINDQSQIIGYGLFNGAFSYYLLSLASQDPNQPPVAVAGPDQSQQCPGAVTLDGSASSDPDGDTLSFTWSQNGVVFATDPAPTINLPTDGTYVLDLTVTDPDGAASTDSVTVIVQDTTPPNVSCPVEVTEAANADCLVAVPDLTTRAVASDNCTDSLSLNRSQSPAPGTLVGVGHYAVTVTVSDQAGNSASCVTSLTVVDVTAPHLECPEPADASADGDLNQAPVPDFTGAVHVTDNCSSQEQISVVQSPAPGSMLGLGVHEVTMTVSDQAGNQASCTTTFTVVDTTPPVVVAPEPAVVRPNDEGLGVVPNFLENLQASDNVTPREELVATQKPAAGTLLKPGTHLVTIQVSDHAGNTTTVTTSLTVLEPCKLEVFSVTAVPSVLSPPNHKMIPVMVTVAAESTCGEVVSKIISVTSSEPVTGGKDKTSPDWEITGVLTVNLRAETSSKVEGRFYTILVESRDSAGNISKNNVTVSVLKKNNDSTSSKTTTAENFEKGKAKKK